MEPLIRHEGKVVYLNRANVDTDQIIPKQFLKRIERTGYGQFLFYDWRYKAPGELNPSFELNQPACQGASILLSEQNFGCGSSREHAVWALRDFGFRVILAPSFADIFYNNCFKNGVLPVVLDPSAMRSLEAYRNGTASEMKVDVEHQSIETYNGIRVPFEIDPHRKQMLIEGLDDIGLTLRYQPSIELYEREKRKAYQYVYTSNSM